MFCGPWAVYSWINAAPHAVFAFVCACRETLQPSCLIITPCLQRALPLLRLYLHSSHLSPLAPEIWAHLGLLLVAFPVSVLISFPYPSDRLTRGAVNIRFTFSPVEARANYKALISY